MPKRLILIVLVVLTATFVSRAQAPKLTLEEKKAASAIKLEYNRRLNETGRIDDLIADMFVSDVSTRWFQEARERDRVVSPDLKGQPFYLQTFLQCSPRLLDRISAEEWKELTLASTNWTRAFGVVMVNRLADLKAQGKDLENINENDELASVMSPLKNLFSDDPILSTIIAGDDTPIKTVEDAHRVAGLLRQAHEIYLRVFTARAKQLSSVALKGLAATLKEPGYAASVEVLKRPSYGFPAGTRFVDVYASPAERVVIVRQGADYKIVYVYIEIGD